MSSRTSGCMVEMFLTSHSVCRWLMTSREPRWWISPVYSAASRLLTNRAVAAARRHAFRLARDIPGVEEVLKHTSGCNHKYMWDVKTYHRRSYRKAALGRWIWTLCEEANWRRRSKQVSLSVEKQNTMTDQRPVLLKLRKGTFWVLKGIVWIFWKEIYLFKVSFRPTAV